MIVAEALTRKGLLSVEEAKILLNDSETRIRTVAIRRLMVLGESMTASNIRELLADASKEKPNTLSKLLGVQDKPRPDDLVEVLFWTFPYEELNRLVSWFTLDGSVAYKVLGLKYFDQFGDRVRKDLADQFETFREAEKRSLRESFKANLDKRISSDAIVIATAVDAAEKAVAKWAHLDNFITSQFMRAALAALVKNGSGSDLPIARQHLDSEDSASREATLEIVSRFGDRSDVESLLVLAARE